MRANLLIVLVVLAMGAVRAGDVTETETVVDGTEAETRNPASLAEDVGESADDGETTKEKTQEKTKEGPTMISGMSILGNQEAPKSLVIVPWKSSEIGESLGISTMLDDSRQPIDRDVFMRALSYYEIRSERTP